MTGPAGPGPGDPDEPDAPRGHPRPQDGDWLSDPTAFWAGQDPAGPGGSGAQPEPEPPEPVFASVEDWLAGYFLPMFRRTLGSQFRWCPQWWAHPEAVTRLTAVWRAWEVLRLEPATGISDWFRDHFDHHFPILCGPQGPFYQCDPEGGGHIGAPPFPVMPVDYEVLDGQGMNDEPGHAGMGGGS